MFKWIEKQGAESSKGFIFRSAHRFYYHYIEGDHTMVIFVEGTFDDNRKHTLLVDNDFNKNWETPFNEEEISKEKMKEIKQNIIDALEFMEINYKFTKL